MGDPLKFFYVVILPSDAAEDTTPFQGFSAGWVSQHWALHTLATLPADMLEPSQKAGDIIAQRMGGLRSIGWAPLNIKSLHQTKAEDLAINVVLFTGEEATANEVQAWISKQKKPVLQITTHKVSDAILIDEFKQDNLKEFCKKTLSAYAQTIPADVLKTGYAALENWMEREIVSSGLKGDGHNIFTPNYMSLTRAFRSLEDGEPFLGNTENEYSSAIIKSVQAVESVRTAIGIKPIHYLTLLRPSLILAEPALYRGAYKRIREKGIFAEKIVAQVLRFIQTQNGLRSDVDKDFLTGYMNSKPAQQLMALRQSELETFSLAVGLHAAQTTAGVMRLSPAVNHVFGDLSNYARSLRSNSAASRIKARRLFEAIQSSLTKAVGNDRIEYLRHDEGPFKIVSDVPIEWLPIDGLPLSMRYDCSRINATPGNLMMGMLTEPKVLPFAPSDLQNVLVISSFKDGDALRNMMKGSIEAVQGIKGKVKVTYKSAKTEKEFIDALNAFDGHIMVFDGHGSGNSEEPVGKLVIGEDLVDVWQLRTKVRVPAIVILSACDTHGIDASTQATVGNGFLALGARTVVATMLPVDGFESSSFVARLIYRLADFLPAALSARYRALNWTEVIAGMLRMTLASEILDSLIGPPAPSGSPRGKLQSKVNMYINAREANDWYERFISDIAEHRNDTIEVITHKAAGVIARSESIRYVQLGNPETIMIDDGQIRKRVLETYGKEADPKAKPE